MKIHFGKHIGMELDDVPASYLLYLYEKEIVRNGAIYDYIVKNIDGIKKQIEDGDEKLYNEMYNKIKKEFSSYASYDFDPIMFEKYKKIIAILEVE